MDHTLALPTNYKANIQLPNLQILMLKAGLLKREFVLEIVFCHFTVPRGTKVKHLPLTNRWLSEVDGQRSEGSE